MLRSLLTYARNDDSIVALAEAARREPQRAFVSASLRPYLLASLIDSDPDRPALVVAGDDRAARDLAADLQGLPGPRPVRFYPARGHALRVPPGPAAAPGGPAHRRPRCAAGRPGRRARDLGGRAGRKGSGPRPAPPRLRDREGRPARPRRGGRAVRGLRLRAGGSGRGAGPVRHPRRHPRRLPGHRGARGALRAVRHRGRAAHLVLHLHPALAGGGGAGGDRPRGRARARASRAGGDRRRHRRGRAPGRGRRAARGPLLRAARPRARATRW